MCILIFIFSCRYSCSLFGYECCYASAKPIVSVHHHGETISFKQISHSFKFSADLLEFQQHSKESVIILELWESRKDFNCVVGSTQVNSFTYLCVL